MKPDGTIAPPVILEFYRVPASGSRWNISIFRASRF